MIYCSNCGAELKGSKIFCPECRYRHNPGQIDKMIRKARITGNRPPPAREERPEPQGSSRSQRKEPDRKGTRVPSGPEERVPQEPEVYEPRKAASTLKEDAEFVRDGKNVTILKEGCSYCDKNAERRCFFCYAPVCDNHTDSLKIFVRKNPFGKVIRTCPDCASERHGQIPSQQEAEKANMFFNVKPYHEWRRVRG